mgnify:CR=1 FL=1
MKCKNFLCHANDPLDKELGCCVNMENYVRDCPQRKAFNRVARAFNKDFSGYELTPLHEQWIKEAERHD